MRNKLNANSSNSGPLPFVGLEASSLSKFLAALQTWPTCGFVHRGHALCRSPSRSSALTGFRTLRLFSLRSKTLRVPTFTCCSPPGEISLGHADALASAWRSHREEFADIEQQFLDAIPGRDVDSFNRLVKQWEWRITKNGSDDVEKEFERRSICAQSTLSGSVTGSFSLPGHMGEVFLDGIFSTPDPASGVVEPRTLRQRQADTLIENLTGEITGIADDEGSTSASGAGSDRRTKIDAVIDIATLGGIIDGVGKQWSLEDLRSELHRSGQLPPAVIEMLVCDAVSRSARTHLSALGRRNVPA